MLNFYFRFQVKTIVNTLAAAAEAEAQAQSGEHHHQEEEQNLQAELHMPIMEAVAQSARAPRTLLLPQDPQDMDERPHCKHFKYFTVFNPKL